ncbi:MAG: RnfABCDGE type electron transport complex subunit C, partial [Bacilli bacterium]
MFFSGKGQAKLEGKKELSTTNEVCIIDDFEYVYIPLMNMNVTDIKPLVSVGAHVLVGDLLGQREDHFYMPIRSSVSGEVIAIEKRMSSSLVYAQFVVIKNDFKYEKGPFGYDLSLANTTKEMIVDVIKTTGITGAGGSGFPTYIKYHNVSNINTVLINGVECEPYITIDYHMMKSYPNELIAGAKALLKASDAQNVIIAFKKGKQELKQI